MTHRVVCITSRASYVSGETSSLEARLMADGVRTARIAVSILGPDGEWKEVVTPTMPGSIGSTPTAR